MKNVERDSEQEQSHDQAADLKLTVIKTHAVLVVAIAVKLNPISLDVILKLDQQTLKWPYLWHLSMDFN